MADLIVPVGAGALGYVIGGPTGAALGFTLGASLTQEKQTLSSGTIGGDLRVQTSTYGAPIPMILTRQRVAGNIIWSADKQQVVSSQKVGKGGGQEVQTTTYTLSFAVMICKGEIADVWRVWADGRLIVDSDSGNNTVNLPGTLYYGTNTQNPDPTIESVEGSGNVPSYRGIAYMVMTDFDLGVSGRVPMLSFDVVKKSSGL